MGYKLPNDVGAIDGVSWYLVAIPDDPVLRTAALGAYTDLAHYWKWGLEEVEDDSYLVQQLWLEAIDETMELIEMGFPDTLLGYIDEVETLLKAIKALPPGCCPENVVYFPPDGVEDPGHDYFGPEFPDPWGDDNEMADLEAWQEAVCGAAHAWVDKLVGIGAEMDALVVTGAIGMGAIAGILGLLAGAGIILPLAYGFIASITTGIIAAATSELFGDASDDIETNRTDLVCKILMFDASDLADEVEATVSSLAWSLFFSHIDWESGINVIQTGEHNGEYLVHDPLDTCDCQPPEEASGYFFHCTGTNCRDFDTDNSMNDEEMYYNRIYKVRGDSAGRCRWWFTTGASGPRENGIDAEVIQVNRGDAGDSCVGETYGLILYDKDDLELTEILPENCEAYTGTTEDCNRMRVVCCGAWNEGADKGFIRIKFTEHV